MKNRAIKKNIISTREKEVLFLISIGMTTKEISQKLFISNSTVNTHRKNLLRKTQTRNTAELICLAIKNSLI